MRTKSSGQYQITQLIMVCVLLFPISSMLKIYISPLNLIITGAVFALFAMYYLRMGVTKLEALLIIYTLWIVISNCIQYRMDFYNKNMLLYFPFMILYFLFSVRNFDLLIDYILRFRIYINRIVYSWCFIVFISFFIPSCYVYEGETRAFVSFATTTFLLSPISTFIFALLALQYVLYRKKIDFILLAIPSLAILMGSTRTYLVVLLCSWAVFLYAIMKNKRYYNIMIAVFAVVALGVILMSPIMNKFEATLGRVDANGLDFWNAFTSGRSVFWAYDLNAIFHNSIDKILFGNGINYLFYLNEPVFHIALWAHNDYIQILSDYGFLGLFVYLYLFYFMIKNMLRNVRKPLILMICLIMLWAFNAFFNMFYTYFCATLSFPFYVLLVKIGASQIEFTK